MIGRGQWLDIVLTGSHGGGYFGTNVLDRLIKSKLGE